ncbi:MAG: pantoate kinase [Candidatus Thorarchaeota archaeon]
MKSQGENPLDTARAFVPGHITGIFRIHDEHEDPLHCGSIGAGFCVDIGTSTTVTLVDNPKLEVSVAYNGRPIKAPVTTTVIQRLLRQHGRVCKVEVDHESMLPIGVGFGASGAGALGTAIALCSLVDIEFDSLDAAQHAHYAEVVNRTGLGDVIAQTTGGVEIRIKPGAPGIGEAVKIPVKESLNIVLAGAPGLETKTVLTNKKHRGRIIKAADELMEELVTNPTFESFIHYSKQFAHSIGLMTPRVQLALNELEAVGLNDSSMVMLGDSIFCFCRNDQSAQAIGILSRIWDPNQIQLTGISEDGGRLVL